jgi:branched-chain amino acid transport system substrate-binding protein
MGKRFLGALAVAFVVAACGGGSSPSSSTASSGTPFNVLTVSGISGSTGSLVIPCINGFQAAALSLNKQGGIMGHKVVLKNIDTQGNATQAVSLLTQQVNSGTTWNLAYPGGTSDEELAEMPTVNNSKILNMASASAAVLNDPTKFPYHFGTGTVVDDAAKLIADYVQKQNFKKPALFTEDNAFGQSEQAAIGKAFKAANISYAPATFSATAVDVAPVLLQLQSQGVDGVVWSATGANIGYVLKSRLKVGYMVPFIDDLGAASGDNVALSGSADAVKNVVEQQWSVNVAQDKSKQTAAFKDFSDSLHQVAVTINTALNQSAACWDELTMANLAANQAKSLDPDKLKTALENLKVPNPSPFVGYPAGYGYSKTNHFPHTAADTYTFVKAGPIVDGQIQPLP